MSPLGPVLPPNPTTWTYNPPLPPPCDHCYCERITKESGLHKKCCMCGMVKKVNWP